MKGFLFVLIGLAALFDYAYQVEPKINQIQFDRCMEGRSIYDREAIKSCERRQLTSSK